MSTPTREESTAEQSKVEIDRVKSCTKDEDILGVKMEDTMAKKVTEFERIALLIHPMIDHNEPFMDDAEEALQNLIGAAIKFEIDETTRDRIAEWSGDGSFDNKIIDGGESDDEDNSSPFFESNSVPPEPTTEAIAMWTKATPSIAILKATPNSEKAKKKLEKLNEDFTKNNPMQEDQFLIPINNLSQIFEQIRIWKTAKARFLERAQRRSDKVMQEQVEVIGGLLTKLLTDYNAYVKENYYPDAWLFPDQVNADHTAPPPDNSNTNTTNKQIVYPWSTYKLLDGGLLIGYRNFMKNSYKLTVEREIDGRRILSHEYMSQVLENTGDIKKLIADKRIINITTGQSDWKADKRDEFVKVLKCSRAMKSRDNPNYHPPVDCIVQFKDKIAILALSTLKRVLGKGKAENAIGLACMDDNIAPPWHAPTIALRDRRRWDKNPTGGNPNAPPSYNSPGSEYSMGGGLSQQQMDNLAREMQDLKTMVSQFAPFMMQMMQMMQGAQNTASGGQTSIPNAASGFGMPAGVPQPAQ